MLSLYEFYLLANLYDPGSQPFRKVLERAATMYPNEKINRISMAMFSFLDNNIHTALEFLRGLEEEPDAWLYFSSFYIRINELDKAEHFARRAAEAGNPSASEHLIRIGTYRADKASYQKKVSEWEKYGIDRW